MFLIPAHNARAPFVLIAKNFISSNFDKNKFSQKCFNGEVIDVMGFGPTIQKTITTKYKNKKKIGILKSSISTGLGLKLLTYQGYIIDFLNSAEISKEKLKSYDLIILEDASQNDNTFRPQDVDPKYELVENGIEFKNKKELNCFYSYVYHKKDPYIDEATERNCFSYEYIKQNNILKFDYKETFTRADIDDKVTIYYFINQIND